MPKFADFDATLPESSWGRSVAARTTTAEHRALRRAVEAFTISSLLNYTFDVHLLPSMKPLPPRPQLQTVKQTYCFRLGNGKRIYATVHFDQGSPTSVGRGSTLQDIFDFFFTLHRPCEDFHMLPINEQTRLQSQWWRDNGMSFRIFDLPRELRDRIWLAACGPVIMPVTNEYRRMRAQFRSTRPDFEINHHLLAASKTVAAECKAVASVSALWYFSDGGNLNYFLGSPNCILGNLRRLELDLTLYETFEVFSGGSLTNSPGQQPRAFQFCKPRWPVSGIYMLRKLHLKVLILRMPNAHSLNRITEPLRGCSKKLVDLLLSVTWPHLEGLPIEVRGGATAQQRIDFETMAQAACRDRLHWQKASGKDDWNDDWDTEDGGVGLEDMTAMQEMGINDKEEVLTRLDGYTPPPVLEDGSIFFPMPPICECEPPCEPCASHR